MGTRAGSKPSTDLFLQFSPLDFDSNIFCTRNTSVPPCWLHSVVNAATPRAPRTDRPHAQHLHPKATAAAGIAVFIGLHTCGSEHTLVRGDEERDWSSHHCMANSHKAFLQPPTLSHPKTSAVPWGLDLRQLLQSCQKVTDQENTVNLQSRAVRSHFCCGMTKTICP